MPLSRALRYVGIAADRSACSAIISQIWFDRNFTRGSAGQTVGLALTFLSYKVTGAERSTPDTVRGWRCGIGNPKDHLSVQLSHRCPCLARFKRYRPILKAPDPLPSYS